MATEKNPAAAAPQPPQQQQAQTAARVPAQTETRSAAQPQDQGRGLDLAARRKEVLEGNRKAEKTRGSGWHPGDLGAEQRDQQNQPALSERPVLLIDNDRVYLIAEDVGTVKEALGSFMGKLERARARAQERGWPPPTLLEQGLSYQDQACLLARRVLSGGDTIELRTQEWNYLNAILGYQNVHVSSALAEVQDYSDV